MSQNINHKVDILIEKYLKDRGYLTTLDSFLKERPNRDKSLSNGESLHVVDTENLETIVNEYEKYLNTQPIFNNDADRIKPIDDTKRFYTKSTDDKTKQYSNHRDDGYPLVNFDAESLVTPFDTLGLVTAIRVAQIEPQTIKKLHIDDSKDDSKTHYFPDVCVLVSGADKSLRCYDARTRKQVYVWHGVHGSAAIRGIEHIGEGLILTGGMDGQFIVTQMGTCKMLGRVKAHNRFINAMSYDSKSQMLVSAGYDGLIKVYKLKQERDNGITSKVEFKPVAQHKFVQIPSVVKITTLKDGRTVVLAGIQDSTLLHYLLIPSEAGSNGVAQSLETLAKLNLLDAEFASSFVVFSPMAIDLYTDEKTGIQRFAIATSHSPYMRVIIGQVERADSSKTTTNQDGEETLGLIEHNLLAHAPQDKFSMPKIKWSHNGNGVWITGDDGLVRGIEIETGKLVVELGKGKHTDKIRDLDIATIPALNKDDKPQDILISGGADKRVFEFFI